MGTPAVNGIIPTGLPSFNDAKGYTYDSEKQRTWSMSIRRLRVIKPVIQLSTNASYVDIGEFLQGMAKNRIRRASRHQSSFHFTPIYLPESFFFRAGLLIIPMRELSIYFTVRTSLRMGQNYTHFKNEEFDRLYDQAFRTNDQKRFILYQKMDQIIIDEIIPLFYDKVARFTRKR
jgi:peptide/nickel transport system substrate-binding protein